MPPPVPPMVLAFAAEASLKLYVPELPLMLMPVLPTVVFTWPLKVMLLALLVEMVTTSAALAWLMFAPQEIAPPLPPMMLNVEPLAPLIVPALAPKPAASTVTALSFTPFVPAVEVTLANVPLTVPVVRSRAVAALTLTEPPLTSSLPKFAVFLMPTVAPLPPVIVAPVRVRLVFVPVRAMPVVAAPLVIVPPLTVTVPAFTKLPRLMPVAAPLVVTLVKATEPMVMPVMFRPAPVVVVTLAVPLTFSVPPPVAVKPAFAPEVMLSVPLKVTVAPVLLVIVTPVGFIVWLAVKEIVPDWLLLTIVPRLPPSFTLQPMVMLPANAGRFWMLTARWLPPPEVMVLVASKVIAAVPLLTSRPIWLPVMFAFVTAIVPVMLVRCRPEPLVLLWMLSESSVRPACVLPAMPSRVPVVMVTPWTVLPSLSVTTSLAAVVVLICGFVPTFTSVLPLTTSAFPSPQSCSLLSSTSEASYAVVPLLPL